MTCRLQTSGATSARSGRSCSGDRSTAASGCTSGSTVSPSTAASLQPTSCEAQRPSSGSEAIEGSTETGDKAERDAATARLFAIVVLFWLSAWAIAEVVSQ